MQHSEEVEVLCKRVNTGLRLDRQLVRGKSHNQIGRILSLAGLKHLPFLQCAGQSPGKGIKCYKTT